MLKFFRKIRYDFISKNKTTKYFKYAIGEIILVMIGILLALQINNWNEGQKDKHLEQTFLNKLKLNLVDDIALYKKVNIGNKVYKQHIDSAIIILESYKNYELKDLSVHLKSLMLVSAFNSNQTAYDNLVSIGKLNIIQNDSLTENLLLYYRRVDLINRSFADAIDVYNRNTFGPLLLEFDYLRPNQNFNEKPLKEYAKEPKIINSLELKSTMLSNLNERYDNQIEKAQNLIELINTQLKE